MEYADSLGFDPVVVECDTAVADYDGDGMAAIIEARLGTNPLLADSDGDGIDDYWEVIAGLDPLVDDAADDPDGDGRTNLEEYQNSGYFYTNPLSPDTDGDGLCDGVTSVMDGATQLCGPGEGDSATPELDAARLRLLAESAIGELTLGDGDTWSDELEEGDTLKLAVAGALDAGTYTVRFDNGSGSVFTIEAYVSEGATYILVDAGDLGDDAGSGSYDIDVVDDSGSSLLDSGAASVNISQRLYLHYGLHSPVVATNSDGETVWRRAYLPFGGDFAGSPSHPLTIANSSITHGFVGRRSDNDVGLYQLGARWYDPDLGRFVSVDPVFQDLNQYAYANNNPFVYQDGDGRDPMAMAALIIYAAGGIGVGVPLAIVGGLDGVGAIPSEAAADDAYNGIRDAWDVVNIPGDVCAGLSFTATGYKIAKNPRGFYNGVKGSINGVKGLLKGSADDAAEGAGKAVLEAAEEVGDDAVDINLKYKHGWSNSQRAAADGKVKALTEAETKVVKNPSRSGTAQAKYRKDSGLDASMDADHTIDLQLNGVDDMSNISGLDRSVNRSLGAQIQQNIKQYPEGTRVNKVIIKDE